VIVLTSFLGVVNTFRKQPLVLFPDEVSRYWTQRWSHQLVAPAGLRAQKSHFSIRDLFTYVVMVARKAGRREPSDWWHQAVLLGGASAEE